MLACLEKRNAELDKIEREFDKFDFTAFGVTSTFMMMTRPSLVQAEIFSRVSNKEAVHIERISMAASQCQDIYFPSEREVIAHFTEVDTFVRRAKRLHDKFELIQPFNLEFMMKIGAELADTIGKMPIVPKSTPQYPQYLPSSSSPAPVPAKAAPEVKQLAPKKEAEDEGVSFFKNKGCFVKKK
jgi:hypothetical protein